LTSDVKALDRRGQQGESGPRAVHARTV